MRIGLAFAAMMLAACSEDREATGAGGSSGASGTMSSGGMSAGGSEPAGGAGGSGGAGAAGGGGMAAATSGLMLVGSGDFGGSTGAISVWRLDYDSGEAVPLDSVTDGTLKSFMAVDEPRRLVHVGDETEGDITTYELGGDGSLTFRATSSSVGNPVHLALNPARTHLFVSHYGPGRTEVMGLDANGWVASSLDDVATGGQTHSTLVPSATHLFAASKDDDHIAQLSFDGANLTVNSPVTTAAGSGPRHMAKHPTLDVIYVVNELHRTLDTFTYDPQAGTLAAAQGPIGLDLPGGPPTGTAADIHVHPGGAFLFASLRRASGAAGELVRCDLDGAGLPTAVVRTETGGTTPRNFAITEDGRYVVVANQDSDNIVIFSVSPGGVLTPGDPLTVASKPFFVTVIDE